MPTFDIETEEITAFDTGDESIFKTYFDGSQLFKRLETYHNENKYRLEIPDCDLERVRQILEKYYELTVVNDVEGYCVIVEKRRFKRYAKKFGYEKTQRTARDYYNHRGNIKREGNRERGFQFRNPESRERY